MEIVSNRISATPRSKYVRYGYEGGNTNISGSGSGSANIDLSNYVKLTGETEQTIEGNVLATGNMIAYATGASTENYPIASKDALGMIKIGENLTITEDGTLNAKAGGGASNWSDLEGKPALLTEANIQKWNDNSHTHSNKAILDTITADSIHTHSNKSYLDSINQNLSKTSDVNFNSVRASANIIAYSTGQSVNNFPIASASALGCIKVGKNLTITSDGTLNAEAGGGVSSWNDLTDKPTTLQGFGITDGVTSSTFNSHTGNTTVHITATERTNWNDANSKKHTHSNKSYLDVINQDLATTSSPAFKETSIGPSNNVHILLGKGSGNCINGVDSSNSVANLYFNYQSDSSYTKVDGSNNVTTTGNVSAFSTGTASAPFKYWKPSVDADGNISWTNTTSTTAPTTRNIKGTKGDKGDTGKSVGKVSAYSTSSASGGSSVYRVYDTSNSLLGSFTVYNGAKGDKGDKGDTGATGATGSASAWLQIKNKGTDRSLVTPANYPGNYLGAYAGRWGDYWQYFLYSSGTTAAIGWITAESSGTNYGVMSMARSGSTVNITASNGKFLDSSDARKKNVISECDINLNDIANIKNYHFRWKDEDDSAPIKCGVLAQDLLQNDKFIPFVSTYKDADGKEWYSVDYSGLGVAIASTGVKELYQLVKNQQAKIDELEQRLAIIESNK